MPLVKEKKQDDSASSTGATFVLEKRVTSHPTQSRLSIFEVLSDQPFSRILPHGHLFLGVDGQDGFPITIELADPLPGPLLITADNQQSMLEFQKTIAQAVDLRMEDEGVDLAVITEHSGNWQEMKDNDYNVCSPNEDATTLLHSLVDIAKKNAKLPVKQQKILLIDDLTIYERLEPDAATNLRWLLLRGPAHGVWPIIALKSSDANWAHQSKILEFFRTRIFGSIHEPKNQAILTGSNSFPSPESSSFVLKEGTDQWRNFWIPTSN